MKTEEPILRYTGRDVREGGTYSSASCRGSHRSPTSAPLGTSRGSGAGHQDTSLAGTDPISAGEAPHYSRAERSSCAIPRPAGERARGESGSTSPSEDKTWGSEVEARLLGSLTSKKEGKVHKKRAGLGETVGMQGTGPAVGPSKMETKVITNSGLAPWLHMRRN